MSYIIKGGLAAMDELYEQKLVSEKTWREFNEKYADHAEDKQLEEAYMKIFEGE